MSSRRDFLKDAATGALVLGAQSKLGLAAMLDKKAEVSKSKVVVARDAALHGSDGKLDEKRVQALLDRAIATYTGHDKPVDAWKSIVPVGKVIGLKVNGLGGKGISTHPELVMAVCERLQQAGVKPGEIIVWERDARSLAACGLTVSTDPNRIRIYGNDVAGYEDEGVAFGSVANVKLAKILTRECAMVINLPILKDHELAGVTFSMKNMYGVVAKPNELHAGGCNPSVADLNCIPAIREKVRFTIGDAMSSVYNGGPGFHPEHLWQPNALIVGQDRVAVDHTAWQMIERKRAEVGMPTLEAANRPPRYIATAADQTHNLGVNDPQRIHLMEV
ncbi:MAG: DUF362 domain-containing protein [Terracidiphilus sp.]|jgi:uncharacterized protein (DUF362 family)